MSDHAVALAGDDGLGIVVAVLLALGDELLHALGMVLREADEFARGPIALKELDGVVAALLGRDACGKQVLDMGENVLDSRVEFMLGHMTLGGRRLLDLCEQLVDALVLKSRDHDDRAAQTIGELLNVNLVAGLLNKVGHVEGGHDGQARLDDLESQVQVTLEIGGVDNLNDDIGLAAHEVVARALLLGAVRRQRVDAGEVRNGHALVAQELGFLFLNRDARPVANITVGTGNQVEQRGLAAVGVTRKSNMDLRIRHAILLPIALGLLPYRPSWMSLS